MRSQAKQHTLKVAAWRRVLAFMIDVIAFDFLVLWPFRLIISMIAPANDIRGIVTVLEHNASLMTLFSGMLVMMALLFIAYASLTQYLIGKTAGMHLLSLKLSGPQHLWRCVLRNIFIIPVMPFILLWLIDPVFYLLSPTKQRLTEYLSGTGVVYEK